jgi:hypothetical protein
MAYFPIESRLGLKGFANVDTATALPFGTIVRGQDSVLGGGEFTYLPGVASQVAGSLVTYNPNAGQKVVLAPSTANLDAPLAVAMSAATSGQFGWYQIQGVALVKKITSGNGSKFTTFTGVPIFISGTAGSITALAASGKQVLGARTANLATVASATSTVAVYLNRPFAQGQVV